MTELEDRTAIERAPYAPIDILSKTYEPEAFPMALEGYAIHVGIYAGKERKRARRFAKHGPFVVTVFQERVIGSGRFGHLYVRPEHRGKGIGSAMYAEMLRRWPERGRAHYTTGILVTAGGEASVRRAWATLEANGEV